jgi:hypothetical protein
VTWLVPQEVLFYGAVRWQVWGRLDRVGVALGGADPDMALQPSGHFQQGAARDQNQGKGGAEVVNKDIRNFGLGAHAYSEPLEVNHQLGGHNAGEKETAEKSERKCNADCCHFGLMQRPHERAPCPRYSLPIRRDGHHQHQVQGGLRRNFPAESAAVLRMTHKLPETRRTRTDKSVARTGKRCPSTKMRQVRSLASPHQGILGYAYATFAQNT